MLYGSRFSEPKLNYLCQLVSVNGWKDRDSFLFDLNGSNWSMNALLGEWNEIETKNDNNLRQISNKRPGPWFLRPSYLHNGISYTGEMVEYGPSCIS